MLAHLVSTIFWLAVLGLVWGMARRAVIWKTGRSSPFDGRGLLQIPKRYFVDLHDVVAREPFVARAHVGVAGGAILALALVALNYGLGLYWPVLEALLQSQKDWVSNHTARPDLMWPHLDGTALNMEQLAIDLTAPDLKQAIAQDLADANTLGVSQTPEYFVNGRPLPSFGFEQLQQLVREELARVR